MSGRCGIVLLTATEGDAMTTKTYIPLGDVPQALIDYAKGEDGMAILHFAEVRSKVTGAIVFPERDVLVIDSSSDLYCSSCDEYVDSVVEIGLTWYEKDGDDSFEYETEEIGDAFCPECQESSLASSEEEYWDAARDDYETERALDAWRGID